MPDKKPLVYYGEIKVENGKYEKDGIAKTRYHAIGKIFHSPHLSRMSIYLYPTATTEGKWVNAYPHEGYEKPKDAAAGDEQGDALSDLSGIPF